MSTLKKTLSIFLAVLMLVSSVPATGLTAFAFEAEEPVFIAEEAVEPIVPEGYYFTGKTNFDENDNRIYHIEEIAPAGDIILEMWIDENGNEVPNPDYPLAYDVDDGGEPIVKGDTLPSSYDSRDYGLVTPVEYQVGGTCWAHASASIIESAYLKKFGTTYDISEYHTVWYGKNGYYSGNTESANDGYVAADLDENMLNSGGNLSDVSVAMTNFAGGVLESRYSLQTEDNSSRWSESELISKMQETFTYDEKYNHDVILESVKTIPYSINGVKQGVYDYGAVEIFYCSETAYYNYGKYTNGWNIGDKFQLAFYCPDTVSTNHAVTIVGWDDNFSRENFGTYKPENDGAWLVKNSWSTRWGNYGYFWISYEDNSIYQYTYVAEVGIPEEYEDVYLYDGRGYQSYTSSYSGAANIFTARNNIYISKIGYGSTASKDYTLKIYKGLDENATDPAAGTLIFEQSGNTKGEKYISVEGDVKLNEGDRFSVVLEMSNVYYEGTSNYKTCKAGDSFYYSSSSDSWTDAADTTYGNACIRAVAKLQKETDTYKVTYKDTGYYSETAQASAADGTVALPEKEGHTYILTYNGKEFTGMGITQDITVNMHCYPTDGTVSESNACTTVYECIYCGEKMKDDLVNHDYTLTVVPATVKSIGYTLRRCRNCTTNDKIDYTLYEGADGGEYKKTSGLSMSRIWWQYIDGNLSILPGSSLFKKMPDFKNSSETPWVDYLGEITTLTVGDGITYIGDYCFSDLPALSELNLTDDITEIGDYCFSGANAIKSFTCPDSLTKIGTYAFNNAISLENINYNDTIATISSYAYYGCSSLTEGIIPGTVTSVGTYIFRECPNIRKIIVEEGVTRLTYVLWCSSGNSKLEEIVLPSTVTNVTFMNYAHLNKYTVSPDNKVYCSVDGVVYSKDMTVLHAYPATKSDKYYKIPESVTSINNYVFSFISGLKYLDMSDCGVTTIKDKTFNQTKTLVNVNLPEAITQIWYQAFYRTRIDSIYVPATVTTLQNPPFTTDNYSSTYYFVPSFYTDSEDAAIKTWADENSYECSVLHTEHDFSTEVAEMSEAPSCKDGKSFKTCECGSFEYKTVPATGAHSLVKGETVAPDCNNGGYTVYTCSVCGTTVNQDEVAALGHNYTWVTDTEATCGANGAKHEKCTRCDAVRSEGTVIPATGEHSYTSVVTKAATHTQTGIKTYTCSGCGDSYTETIAKLEGHTYNKVVTDPTCTAKGYTTYTCACGDTYTADEAAALGHNYKSEVTKAPTCTEKGVETYTCARCDDSYTKEIAATGHSYKKVVTDPTCTAKGYTTYTCVCGDTYTADEVAALGHNYKAEVTKAPTCTEKGVETYTCARCDDSYTKEIAATGHSIKTVPAKAPTCTADGYKAYEYCEKCSYTTYEKIDATGHSYTKTVTAPTCTAEGYTTYTCVCGDAYTADKVAALGHSFGQWTQTKAPTCAVKGEKKRACSACGETETGEVATLSHTYESTYVLPTCTDKGYTIYKCTGCSYSYTGDYLDAVGHSDGNADGICDTCGNEIPKEPAKECTCMCHKTGFMGFIYKIVKFFWKLFKMNPVCECGVAHY